MPVSIVERATCFFPKTYIVLHSPGEDTDCGVRMDPLITAANLGKKIWNTTKLESVLTRLLGPPSISVSVRPVLARRQPPSLARLLKSEQVHGTTERDPTQKRHDFKYFTRGSKFVLVEDLRQELATIAVYEYPVTKTREGTTAPAPWPVLHCHPQSRGPFIPYDDKEKRRWEKLQNAEGEEKEKRRQYRNKIKQAEVMKRKVEANLHAKRTGDLRRSVSMNNLHRRATFPTTPHDEYLMDDGNTQDSINASGFLASGTTGYMAASGNSVGITSTAGTTSTAGYTSRNTQLPPALTGRMKQHIVTSRKFPSNTADKENKVALMGPPTVVPERQPMLRKSRSMNTLKLPKREEGSKPGYCESCRLKFPDFKMVRMECSGLPFTQQKSQHIASRKHKRFAMNDANFLQLDCVLARVQRRTKHDVFEERIKREQMRRYYCGRVQENRGHVSDVLASSPENQSMQHEDTEMHQDLNGVLICS